MGSEAASEDFDPTRVPHLGGRFAPVTDEVDVADLVVDGRLPPELAGVLVRNGPNPRFSPIGSYLYPIDGDGMVHAVSMAHGRARYRNRFVRTPAVLAEERAGRALWGGIESMITPSEPDVPADLAGTFRDMPDVNVVRHAGRLLALAESAPPFRMAPDLGTEGPESFGGALPAGITAHPKIDPRTGEMAVFCYALEPPYLTWAMLGHDGTVTRGPTPVPGVDEAVMIHDMALTARYLVLVLAPAFFDLAAAFSGGSLIAWRPERGTRVALIPRDGSAVRWATDEAFWLWHTVNAYDTGEGSDARVVLDYVEWPHLSLGHDPHGTGGAGRAGLTRMVIDPAAGRARRVPLDDARVELPRVDDRLIGHTHRRTAMAAETGRVDLISGEFDALRWYDLHDTTADALFWPAGDLSVGEPVHVPPPEGGSDAAGWWMTYATDRTDGTSRLLVISDADPEAGPVASVHLPVRVPLGLHGSWLPTVSRL